MNEPRGGPGSADKPRGRAVVRSQDLVMLPALRALLRERNVTRAGESIGLTQPATSNALARLRRRFSDELLVRVGREYRLTPLAQNLLERVDDVFVALERLYEDPFDPATTSREYTLVLSDYSVAFLADTLVPLLKQKAPGARLHLKQLSASAGGFDDLLRDTDGIILPPDYIRGHPSVGLFRDYWVCVVGSNAPVADEISIDDIARLPWVSPFGPSLVSSAPPVRQLRAAGIEPRVEVTVDSFQAAVHMVTGTDRIAFVPARLAAQYAHKPGLRLMHSPLAQNDHRLSLYWDAGETNDPGHRWFRQILRCAATAAMEDGRTPQDADHPADDAASTDR